MAPEGGGDATAYLPGDPEYRAFVGPFEQYDVMGATQFALLYALGLRQHHRLLDIGCGSLRVGRMLIAYLNPDRYVGVEPNRWLVDEAVSRQLGSDIVELKRPVFSETDAFDVSGLGSFDFVLAQSIASHTGPALVARLLRGVREALAPGGLAAITFVHAPPEDPEVVHVSMADDGAKAWLYPGCYSYERAEVEAAAREAGLDGVTVPWFHPRQTWWLLARDPAVLPSSEQVAQLTGVSMARGFEASFGRPPAGGAGATARAPRDGREVALEAACLVYRRLPPSLKAVARHAGGPLRERLALRRG